MSTEAFEDFYFDVCNLDYPRLAQALEPLVERMDAAARGPHHRARDRPAVLDRRASRSSPAPGEMNIPDGEVFTAPVRDSVEGHVRFNAPTIYQGISFDGVRLEFAAGPDRRGRLHRRATSRSCGGSSRRTKGRRYIGEWSIGCNPRILHPMRDILFDEKIAGSFHLTPGNAYDEADNGNRSKIHWDLVQIQRPEYGGGTIAFDGVPIRVDGRFVPDELQALDPE